MLFRYETINQARTNFFRPRRHVHPRQLDAGLPFCVFRVLGLEFFFEFLAKFLDSSSMSMELGQVPQGVDSMVYKSKFSPDETDPTFSSLTTKFPFIATM